MDYKSLYEQASQEREEICNELGLAGIPPTKEILLDKIKILNIDNKKLNKFKDEAEENSLSFPVVESLMNDVAEAKSTQRTFETLYIKFRNYISKIHEEIFEIAGGKLGFNYRGWWNLNSIMRFNCEDIDDYIKEMDWREEKSLDTLKEIMTDAGKSIDYSVKCSDAINFIERYYIPDDELNSALDEESLFVSIYMKDGCDDDYRFPLYEDDDYDDDYDEGGVMEDGLSRYVYKNNYNDLCDIKKYWDMYRVNMNEGIRINKWIDCMNEY
jgi:hypothetical protein